MNRYSPDALSTIAHHAERDYVSAPTISLVGSYGRIAVAILHFRDGGERLVTSDWWGNYRDHYSMPDGWYGNPSTMPDSVLLAISDAYAETIA